MAAYLSAREAADYCGASEKTIRNWLATGRLSADKSAGSFHIPQAQLDAIKRNGPRSPQDADRQAEGSAEEVRAESPHLLTAADVLSMVREAQAEAIAKAEAAAMWQARAEMLAHQLAVTGDRLRALEAPRTHVASNLTAQAPAPPSGSHPNPHHRRCPRRSRRTPTGRVGGAEPRRG